MACAARRNAQQRKNTARHGAMQCNATQDNAAQRSGTECNATQRNATQQRWQLPSADLSYWEVAVSFHVLSFFNCVTVTAVVMVVVCGVLLYRCVCVVAFGRLWRAASQVHEACMAKILPNNPPGKTWLCETCFATGVHVVKHDGKKK